VERQAALPPVGERHLAAPDGPEPLGRLALDRQVQSACRQELRALEAETGGVHGVLRVVAVGGDELLAAPAPTAAVAAAPKAEQPQSLRLHVAAVPRDDVATD